MHAIERELVEITKLKRTKFSNRQDYLKSIITATSQLEDEDFNALSEDAAEWVNVAIEMINAKGKNADIPDFDEIEPDEEADDPDTGDGDEVSDTSKSAPAELDHEEAEGELVDGDEEDTEIDDSPVAQPESRKKAGERPKAIPKRAKVPAPPERPLRGDAVLDKWGAIQGSKNSQALALFEKGATTREVKDQLDGTYYNILKKMVEAGHKVEKDGSLVKLTHKSEVLAQLKRRK